MDWEACCQYFLDRGLQTEADYLQNHMYSVEKLLDEFDFVALQNNDTQVRVDGYPRKVVHLVAEAHQLRSNTVREHVPQWRWCKKNYIPKHMIVGRSVPLTKRSRGKKRQLYYKRKTHCSGQDKTRATLQPLLDC